MSLLGNNQSGPVRLNLSDLLCQPIAARQARASFDESETRSASQVAKPSATMIPLSSQLDTFPHFDESLASWLLCLVWRERLVICGYRERELKEEEEEEEEEETDLRSGQYC
jgi:hypothetical protein